MPRTKATGAIVGTIIGAIVVLVVFLIWEASLKFEVPFLVAFASGAATIGGISGWLSWNGWETRKILKTAVAGAAIGMAVGMVLGPISAGIGLVGYTVEDLLETRSEIEELAGWVIMCAGFASGFCSYGAVAGAVIGLITGLIGGVLERLSSRGASGS
jgi:hypothetical protein